MNNLEQKLDKVLEHVSSMQIDMATIKYTLEHTKADLSKNEREVKEHIQETKSQFEELEPIKEHVAAVKGSIKLIIILATVIASVAAYLGVK